MKSQAPERPRPRREIGVLWACLVSAAAHAALIGLLFLWPSRFATPEALDSYTVELVAGDVIGGNSGPIPGPAGAGLPAAARGPEKPVPPVAEPEPPAVEAEPPAAEPRPEVAAAVPPAVPDDVDDAIALSGQPTPTATPRREATVAATPTTGAAATPSPEATTVAMPTASAKPTKIAATPTRKPVVKSTPAARPTTVAKPTARAKATAAKPTRAAAPPTPRSAVAAAQPTAAKTPSRDDLIAEAVRRRAEAVGAGGEDETSRAIAEAVRRRAAQVEGGAGSAAAGVEGGGGSGSTSVGPLGSGPGEGAGGVVRGIEYILYKRRMEERIREAWAWAGADDSLECVVAFSVDPQGQISAIRTIRSSGDPAYDNSAERAVRAVSPLGPIPEPYRGEFGDVELTFRARDRKR